MNIPQLAQSDEHIPLNTVPTHFHLGRQSLREDSATALYAIDPSDENAIVIGQRKARGFEMALQQYFGQDAPDQAPVLLTIQGMERRFTGAMADLERRLTGAMADLERRLTGAIGDLAIIVQDNHIDALNRIDAAHQQTRRVIENRTRARLFNARASQSSAQVMAMVNDDGDDVDNFPVTVQAFWQMAPARTNALLQAYRLPIAVGNAESTYSKKRRLASHLNLPCPVD